MFARSIMAWHRLTGSNAHLMGAGESEYITDLS